MALPSRQPRRGPRPHVPHHDLTILWFSGRGILSRLIEWVTHSPYSHVAVMLDGVLFEALGQGITRRSGRDADARAAEAVAAVTLPGAPAEALRAWTFLEEHVARDGPPTCRGLGCLVAALRSNYSILGFLAAGLDRLTGWRLLIALDGEYICSGYAATCAVIYGARFDRDPRLVDPDTLADALGVSSCRS